MADFCFPHCFAHVRYIALWLDMSGKSHFPRYGWWPVLSAGGFPVVRRFPSPQNCSPDNTWPRYYAREQYFHFTRRQPKNEDPYIYTYDAATKESESKILRLPLARGGQSCAPWRSYGGQYPALPLRPTGNLVLFDNMICLAWYCGGFSNSNPPYAVSIPYKICRANVLLYYKIFAQN